MATVVEQPTSAFGSQRPLHPSPSRDSIEIIDVDHLASPELVPLRVQRPTTQRQPPFPRRQTEVISLLDSDDDEPMIVGSSSNHSPPRPHRRRLFSPSPPPQDPALLLPPVPPVPSRYAGHTSMPMRHSRRRFPSVVRARNDPFSFEAALNQPVAGPSNSQPEPTTPNIHPAPPSHYSPPMGFGGALLSTRRVNRPIPDGADPARYPARSMVGEFIHRRLPPRARLFRRLFGDFEEEDEEINPAPHIHQVLGDFLGRDVYHEHAFMSAWDHHQNRRKSHEDRQKELYEQSYTHPPRAEPGFTFDFAPPSTENESSSTSRLFPPTSINDPIIVDDDDEDGKKPSGPACLARNTSPSGQLNALLVCARCSAPLLLNAGLDPEQTKDRRVWGLRCGHLIDEKCLLEIGQPSSFFVADSTDKKGKGKQKAPPVPETTVSGDSSPAAESSNIRSRLRSRNAKNTSNSTPTPLPPPPAKRRRVSNQNKVESTHEWTCPVVGCGTVHVSVKVAGVWGPEKNLNEKVKKETRGAIPIFA